MTKIWTKFCCVSLSTRDDNTSPPSYTASKGPAAERGSDSLTQTRPAAAALRHDAPPCAAWELSKPRQPLQKPQNSHADPLASFPDDIMTEVMRKLSPKDVLGLAATCRGWRRRSRDPMLWTAERLSGASMFQLGTLPADILELPTARVMRFSAQVAAAIEGGDEALLQTLCVRPFAGFEALDSAAQGLISDAYDSLASWHLEAHWLDDAACFEFFPHSEVLQRVLSTWI